MRIISRGPSKCALQWPLVSRWHRSTGTFIIVGLAGADFPVDENERLVKGKGKDNPILMGDGIGTLFC